MDREEKERDKLNDLQGAVADEQSEESLCTEIGDTNQPSITCSNCERYFESLQTKKETVLSQQNLTQNLSFFAVNQHQQMQTISSQEEFISILQDSLRKSKAAKLKDDDEQTRFYTGLSSYTLFNSL